MARRNNEPTSVADKAKVRVLFAEVEGNNESVQEALRTMVSAMSRPVRLISEPKTNGNPALLLQNPDLEEVEEAIEQVDEGAKLDGEPSPPPARKPRGSGKKSDRNAGLALVPNLNFWPDGKQSFKQFVDEKAPKNDVEAVLAAVYYMQHLMILDKVGPGHVMTAFKEAGKAIPVDLRQTIRNIKNSRIWINFTDIESIRTTTQGDNFVEHEMGKGNTA
jgi:hypothetical protein